MGRAAACVYIACRQMQLFYTFEEICAISKVDKKVLLTCVKSVSSALAIPRASLTTGDPAAFISRFCAKLGKTHFFEKAKFVQNVFVL